MVQQGIETIASFDVDRPERGRSLEWKTRRKSLAARSVLAVFVSESVRAELQAFDFIR
jgi:hypothetical protein